MRYRETDMYKHRVNLKATNKKSKRKRKRDF